jgi:CubicO group peptidase (beta-lactamase class C family)
MRATAAAGLCLLATLAAGIAAVPLALERASEYSARHAETALLVWCGGRVIYERGGNGRNPPRIFSITKSLVSIGVFRDARIGGISLGRPASHPAAHGVMLLDLLNQTSGLSPAHREFYSTGLRDKQRVLRELRRDGGGKFRYGPAHWEVLAEEIRLRHGDPLDRWVRKFVPGAGAAELAAWRRDNLGRLFFSTGARMDARQLLPAGREVLRGIRGARWPREVRLALASGTAANRMYAAGFWLNRGAATPGAPEIDVEASLGSPRPAAFWRDGCLSRVAPADLLAMVGTRGQRVYVVPSQDVVVIRLGEGAGFSDAEFLRRLFGPCGVSG